MFLLLHTLLGCAPPVAPTELQQLACFIFEHADDEDPTLLAEGLENLDSWLSQDHEEDPEEGYQIDLLVQSAVSDLPGENHNLTDELVGAAVATPYSNAVDDLASATTVDDWEQVMEGQYEYYDKEWLEGGSCIADASCETSSAESWSELVVLGVSIVSHNQIEYRWVDTAMGPAFVHRSWLLEKPEVGSDLVDPNVQYYLAVTLPDSKSRRLQATWIDTKIVGLSVPKNQVAATLRDQAEALDEWVVAHY